jgi:diphthamide biosynthesis protein 7
MQSIEHLRSLTLDLPPSCVEFCPRTPEYAVVGTYNLEKPDGEEPAEDEGPKKSQQRNGSLILLHVTGDEVYVYGRLPGV